MESRLRLFCRDDEPLSRLMLDDEQRNGSTGSGAN